MKGLNRTFNGVCAECGNKFEDNTKQRKGGFQRKYCNPECKTAAKKKRSKEVVKNNPNIWKEKYIRYKGQYAVWAKNYRKKNPEKMLELQREYRKNNLEKVRAHEKRQWQKNKVKISEQSKVRRQKLQDSLSIEAYQKLVEERNTRVRLRYKSLTEEQKAKLTTKRKSYFDKLKKEPVKWKEFSDKRLAYKKTTPQRNQAAAHARRRRREDLQFAVKGRLRCRVRSAIRNHVGGKAVKMSNTMDLVGCSPSKLIAHLESLFTPEMSWELFKSGEIHIDHIKPCSSFNLTKELGQRECFNWANLQPLFAADNLKKSNKLY